MFVGKTGLVVLALASILSVTACGGGGGGSSGSSGGGSSSSSSSSSGSSSGSAQSLSMSVSTNSVSQTASLSDAAPSATVQVFLSSAPTSNIYIGYNLTHNGIANVSFATVNNTTANAVIAFDAPSQLGVGVYNDTLQIAACYDQQCTQLVANSPQTIAVQYTVTAGGGSSSSSGGSSSSSSGGSACSGCGLSVVNVPANDLVYDPTRKLIYLSVPSYAGPQQGNTITAIDPASGSIVATQYAGSEPDVLSISDDGQFLYAGIDGSSSVQRFKLPALTPDINFSMGADSFLGPYYAQDVQVAPGAAHTTAVTRASDETTATGGLLIYDDATARPNSLTSVAYEYNSLQWGNDSSTLYAGNYFDTGFDFYSLSVNASGVLLVQDYSNALNGFSARIHYDKGTALIYNDAGIVLAPTTGTRVGTFQANGPMVPDSSTNSAYFASLSGSLYSIGVFDQSHFTLNSTLTFGNGTSAPGRLILWGSNGLALSTVGGPVYLVTPGGSGSSVGSSGGGGISVGNFNQSVVATPGNDLVWDATHQLIYVSVPSTASSNGNSIVAINPSSGQIVAAQFAGSEPDALAISDDDQFLYVGLDGAGSVQRFKLPGLTPDISIPLGNGSNGSYHALDVQVAPGAPHTTAISLGEAGISPSAQGGIVIFDDATARATKAPGGIPLYDSIQWGSDATALYAANNETTGFDFYTLAVNASGVQQTSDHGNDFPGFFGDIHYDAGTGLVYGDDGFTAIPATGLPAGLFQASGVMVPDSTLNTAFFLGQTQLQTGSSDYAIESFDMTHYTPQQEIALSNLPSTPQHLIRWGTNGLAFSTSNGIYLISGSFVGTTANAALAHAKMQTISPKVGNVHRTWNERKPDPQAPTRFIWAPRR